MTTARAAARPASRRPAPDAERLTWLALKEAAARWRGIDRPGAAAGHGATGETTTATAGPALAPSTGTDGSRPRLQAATLRLDAAAWR